MSLSIGAHFEDGSSEGGQTAPLQLFFEVTVPSAREAGGRRVNQQSGQQKFNGMAGIATQMITTTTTMIVVNGHDDGSDDNDDDMNY